MFESLSQRLSGLFEKLGGGAGRLTEDSVKDAVREVKRALLEADVSLPVTRAFTKAVKEKAVGETVRQPSRALAALRARRAK